MTGRFNGDPELAAEHERFHRALAAAAEATSELGPLMKLADHHHATEISRHVFEWALMEAAERLRAPGDRVPLAKVSADWPAVRERIRGRSLIFRTVELGPDGATVVEHPVALAVPDWPENGPS